MQRFERETTPELPGDELRALNRGDDGPLTFLHVPEQKSGFSSSNSSAADLREYVDDAPIYKYRPSLSASRQYVSTLKHGVNLHNFPFRVAVSVLIKICIGHFH